MSPNLYDAVMSRTWRADIDTRGYSTGLDRILQKVIFNDPATIVFWSNGEKTVVKCCENDVYDPEKGLAMAICKYIFGNDNYFHRVFKDWLPEEKDYDEMGARLFATDVGESIRKALSSIFPKNKEDDHHAEQRDRLRS